MRDFTIKDFLIGVLVCALDIWLLSIGGLIGVVGELLMLPGRLLVGIGSFLIDITRS
jgi:hypothetical protein